MADDKKGAAAASPGNAGGGDAVSPKKSRKLLFIIVGAVVLLAAGAGGAYMFLGKKEPAAEAAETHEAQRKPNYVNLDPFTVNLADDGGERMAQVSVVLDIADAKTGELVAAHMPAIRNNILLLLSSKQSKELLTVSGKEILSQEIAVTAARAIGWTPPPGTPLPGIKAAPQPIFEPAGTRDAGGAAPAGPVGAPPAAQAPAQAAPPPAPRAEASKKMPPNPIESVHFSQFIVQ